MLPKNNAPRYSLLLPSTGQEITYRPFLVKEEKIMFMATSADEPAVSKLAIKQIIENCVDTKLDFDSLSTFDVEWILINLRIMSVGKKIDLTYSCNNEVNNVECGAGFTVSINLGDIKSETTEMPEKEIALGDSFGVKMKHPRFFAVFEMSSDDYFNYKFMAECIEYVYDAKSVYPLKDQSEAEILEFFDSLSREQYDKLQDYVLKLPQYIGKKEHTCVKCGFKHVVEVRDLSNFF